jgi:ribose 5-phosphate isomerase B
VLSIGARMHSVAEATRFAVVFLDTAFTEETRHERRIAMLADYERTHELPPIPSP